MVSKTQQGERCQNLGTHIGHSEGCWASCSSPVFVSGIICVWWTSALQSHWWVSPNHTFSWLWSWGYLGISLKRSLWAPAAVTKESHCWQCPANASCWQTFLLSAKGELLSFWPRQISSLIPSVKRSFLVTFIFPHELEVLLNILFYFCLLH